MDWQLAGVTGTIVISLVYVTRSMLQSWRGERSCGSGCGKCSAEQPVQTTADSAANARRIRLPQVSSES